MSQSSFIYTVPSPPRHTILTALFNKYLQLPSPQPTTPTPTTFHLFPALPTELRLQIWRTTFPLNRTIYLNILTCSQPSWTAEALTFTAPITLSINRESRHETLRFYHSQSHLSNPPSNKNGKSYKSDKSNKIEPWYIYFNPHLDRVRVLHEHVQYRVPYNVWPEWKMRFIETVEILHVEFKEWAFSDAAKGRQILARMKQPVDPACYPDYVGLAKLCIFKSLKEVVLSLPSEADTDGMEEVDELVKVVKGFLGNRCSCCLSERCRTGVKVSTVFGEWKEDEYITEHLA